jgi:hypothetical protein
LRVNGTMILHAPLVFFAFEESNDFNFDHIYTRNH